MKTVPASVSHKHFETGQKGELGWTESVRQIEKQYRKASQGYFSASHAQARNCMPSGEEGTPIVLHPTTATDHSFVRRFFCSSRFVVVHLHHHTSYCKQATRCLFFLALRPLFLLATIDCFATCIWALLLADLACFAFPFHSPLDNSHQFSPLRHGLTTNRLSINFFTLIARDTTY